MTYNVDKTDAEFTRAGLDVFRGFGFPLFAFSFLVWINHVTPRARNATAVGWFYVMFTGGMPTLGSLVAILAISGFGGGNALRAT